MEDGAIGDVTAGAPVCPPFLHGRAKALIVEPEVFDAQKGYHILANRYIEPVTSPDGAQVREPLTSINRSAVAPPILPGTARCARSARHPQPSCEGKPIGAGALIQHPQPNAAAKSP